MSLLERGLARVRAARRTWSLNAYLPVILVIFVVLALLHASPALTRTPGEEAGRFLTIGSQMLRGTVLYRDVWSSEAPLTFVINALGLALGGPGRWGVWLLEAASISAAAWMLFAWMRRFFGAFPAFFAVSGLLGSLIFVLDYGNLPETYGMVLQSGILLLGTRAVTRPGSRRVLFILGSLTGLAVSLRLSLFGLPAAVILCLAVAYVRSRNWIGLLKLAWTALGFGLVGLAWWILFGLQGALPDLWDQVFRYPMLYSGVTNPDRLNALLEVLQSLYAGSGFFALGLLVWMVVLPFLFYNDERFRLALTGRWSGAAFALGGGLLILNSLLDDVSGGFVSLESLSRYRLIILALGLGLCAFSVFFFTGWAARLGQMLTSRTPPGEYTPLLLPLGLVLIDLPLELVLSSFLGRTAAHYFIPILPSVTILTAFLAWAIHSGMRPTAEQASAKVWLAILALPVVFTGWYVTFDVLGVYENPTVREVAQITSVRNQPDGPMLQWGASPQLYFLAGRSPASRYIDSRALFTPGYTSPDKIEAFSADLRSQPPQWLVDTRSADMPLLTAAQADCSRFTEDDFLYGELWSEHIERFPLAVQDPLPFVPSEMKHVYRWVCENYTLAWPENPDPDSWRIYRLSVQPE